MLGDALPLARFWRASLPAPVKIDRNLRRRWHRRPPARRGRFSPLGLPKRFAECALLGFPGWIDQHFDVACSRLLRRPLRGSHLLGLSLLRSASAAQKLFHLGP